MTKISIHLRNIVQKLGHTQVIVIITIFAIIAAEILTFLFMDIFNFPYPVPSTPVVTFLVTAILTPFISWHLLALLFSIDKMEQKMNYLATYDSMTKLFSRQAFFKRSLALHDTVVKSHKTYSVAIIDIDNFKSINDKYGHAYGDKLLTYFGTLILKTLDSDYIIGRIGGEEFAVVLDVDIDTLKTQMDRLHQAVLYSNITDIDTNIAYTISIGLFENRLAGILSFDEALSHADYALYYAKTTGKNKSVVFSESLPDNKFSKKSSNFRSRK